MSAEAPLNPKIVKQIEEILAASSRESVITPEPQIRVNLDPPMDFRDGQNDFTDTEPPSYGSLLKRMWPIVGLGIVGYLGYRLRRK